MVLFNSVAPSYYHTGFGIIIVNYRENINKGLYWLTRDRAWLIQEDFWRKQVIRILPHFVYKTQGHLFTPLFCINNSKLD